MGEKEERLGVAGGVEEVVRVGGGELQEIDAEGGALGFYEVEGVWVVGELVQHAFLLVALAPE